MPAPTYTWEFVADLMGDRVPKVTTLEATSGLLTKVGTLLIMSSGQVDEAGASVVAAIGLAGEEIAVAATAADPIKVELIAPGFLYKGTADADASSLAGFNGKLTDFNTDGSLDVGDTSGGSFSVLRTENSGLTVYGVFTVGAMF
jgi:hypothetical protein